MRSIFRKKKKFEEGKVEKENSCHSKMKNEKRHHTFISQLGTTETERKRFNEFSFFSADYCWLYMIFYTRTLLLIRQGEKQRDKK
jgi:hypothetical protein